MLILGTVVFLATFGMMRAPKVPAFVKILAPLTIFVIIAATPLFKTWVGSAVAGGMTLGLVASATKIGRKKPTRNRAQRQRRGDEEAGSDQHTQERRR